MQGYLRVYVYLIFLKNYHHVIDVYDVNTVTERSHKFLEVHKRYIDEYKNNLLIRICLAPPKGPSTSSVRTGMHYVPKDASGCMLLYGNQLQEPLIDRVMPPPAIWRNPSIYTYFRFWHRNPKVTDHFRKSGIGLHGSIEGSICKLIMSRPTDPRIHGARHLYFESNGIIIAGRRRVSLGSHSFGYTLVRPSFGLPTDLQPAPCNIFGFLEPLLSHHLVKSLLYCFKCRIFQLSAHQVKRPIGDRRDIIALFGFLDRTIERNEATQKFTEHLHLHLVWLHRDVILDCSG